MKIKKIELAAIVALAAVLVAAVWYWRAKREPFADESKVCGGVYFREIPGFLTPGECDDLVAASVDLRDSQVGGSFERSALDLNVRKSKQMWYGPGMHSTTDKIREKTAELVRRTGCVRRATSMEDVQVVRYGRGGKYDAHHDGDDCGGPEGRECPANQRVATLLVYLNDGFEGGRTEFPMLGASVVPEKGKALFFWVADPDTNELFEKTLHAGIPVVEGHKWIANQWVRRSS
jgi:prolyl 4-hydroxylase